MLYTKSFARLKKFIALILIFIILFSYNNFKVNSESSINKLGKLKTSDSWNVSPFIIDDTGGGDYTWAQAAVESWCRGSGSWSEPYVIENITIDASGSGNCLVIRDSTVPFILKNNIFINSGSSLNNAGLKLVNVENGTISNNNISFNNEDGIRLDNCKNITIKDNTASYNERRGIFLSSSSNNFIYNNSATHNGGTSSNRVGIYISFGTDNTIIGNNVSNNRERGIWLKSGSTRNNLSLNQIENNGDAGIYLSDSYNNTFSKNNIVSNGYNGMNLNSAPDTRIIDNTIKNNSKSGIAIYSNCEDSIISKNLIEGNEIHGILISTHQSDKILISYNNITKNYDSGIYFDNSDDNIITNNNIRDNINYGMLIYANTYYGNNLIYNNSFINNTVNAKEITHHNNWNNSVIGNYWDDYDGLDLNGDGIGDSPYDISGSTSSSDFLPIWNIGDTFAPIINISFPKQDDIFGPTSPSYNLTVTDYRLNTTWYSLNGGLNYTFTGTIGTIDQAAWDIFGNETVIIGFYANDSSGNEAYKEVLVHKDLDLPDITINSPITNQTFGISAPNFNISILDSDLNTLWYTLNDGRKYIFSGKTGKINQSEWDLFGSGIITIKFNANNSVGNVATQKVIVRKVPEFSIVRPTPSRVFGNATFNFELLIEESNVTVIWYSLNEGLNYTFVENYGTINQTAWDLCGNGTVSIKFYANTTKGKVVFKNIIIYKDFNLIIPRKAYGIVVGIEDYPSTEYDLNYCRDDAVEINSFLLSDCNFLPENIILLLDSNARFGSIINAFSQIQSIIEPYDIFLFYYSGHGGSSSYQFLCPYDSIPSDPSKYLTDTILDEQLDRLGNTEKYVLIDACRSGGMIPESQATGRYLMTACKTLQDSYEISSLQNGVYTYYFLRSKDYATDTNGDGVISLEEQYIYTEAQTSWYMSHYYGILQNPQEYDGIPGPLVLYPSIGGLSLDPFLNQLDFSFHLYGHGSLKTLNLTIYSISPSLQFKTYDLRYWSSSYVGFGSYSGQVHLDEGYNIKGYELLVQIEGNNLITIYFTIDEDTDGDGLFDIFEIKQGMNPLLNDTDGDELSDYDEFYGLTNPLLNDTEGDGMPDGYEVFNGLDPLVNDSLNDLDNDGLTNLFEYHYGSFVNNSDTDGDGMPDGWEYNNGLDLFSNDANLDPDKDGLINLLEYQCGSDINNSDTDGDTMPDGWEYDNNLNLLINDTNLDYDSDGLTNLFEYQIGTFANNWDTDGDELSDYDEYYGITDPLNSDTDLDGMPDGFEIYNGLDPLVDDSDLDLDNDNLTNFEEYQSGTDPNNEDTDSDGWNDGDEVERGTDPLDPNDFPRSSNAISGYLIVPFISIILIALIVYIKKIHSS